MTLKTCIIDILGCHVVALSPPMRPTRTVDGRDKHEAIGRNLGPRWPVYVGSSSAALYVGTTHTSAESSSSSSVDCWQWAIDHLEQNIILSFEARF